MNKKFTCFITGTDTEVGKTLISSALLHTLAQLNLRSAGMKPVAAGAFLRQNVWCNEDMDQLAAASNVKLPSTLTTPYLLQAAIAPHIASQLEGVTIDLAHIQTCYEQIHDQVDAVVVEGVGGFKVPLCDEYDTADLAQRLGLPVVLVVGLRLGCISQALLTAEAIARRGLVLAGWVANCVTPDMPYQEENIAALKQRLGAPLLGVVPKLASPCAADAAGYLDFSGLPGWPTSD